MPDILLVTLNARYIHASFGLRYLLANMGELRERTSILEFEINQRSTDILETILQQNPKIVGLGVYIWNIEPMTKLVGELKRVRPDIVVILGGPEVSYETEGQEIVRLADHVITGEADLMFAEVCGDLLRRGDACVALVDEPVAERATQASPLRSMMKGPNVTSKIMSAPVPEMSRVALPYDLYTDDDIAHRVVYVEASRGCPFECEFCLSSLDIPVRNVPTEVFLASMQRLLDRGLRQFKFVDRTFNLNLNIGKAILQFFLDRYMPGLFLHFEMIPDRLPPALREWIAKFPAGVLQFEVGIQTFNEEVARRISRRQDNAKTEDNLRWLRESTGVHVHADLIVGLPGETVESFATGFDRLVGLKPQEIQVGMLKRLRGTPIVRHDGEWGMVYAPHAPYEILQTKVIDFPAMQKMRRFARYWDLVANSGNFVSTLPLVWTDASPFTRFTELSDFIYETTNHQTHAISLDRLARMVFDFLTTRLGRSPEEVAQSMWQDLARTGRRDCPEFLRGYLPKDVSSRVALAHDAPARQAKHLQGRTV